MKGKTQKEPKELPFYSTSNATTVGGRRASAITQVSVSKQRGEQPQAKVTTADGQTRTVRIRTSTTQ